MAKKKNKKLHKKSNVLNKIDTSSIPADSNSNNVNETSSTPTHCNAETQQEMCIINPKRSYESPLPLFLFSLVNYFNTVPSAVEILINFIKDNLNELYVHVASNIGLYCDTFSINIKSTIKNAIKITLIHRFHECSYQNCNHSNTINETFSQTEISLVEDSSDEHHMQESQTTLLQNIPKLIRCFRCQFYNH